MVFTQGKNPSFRQTLMAGKIRRCNIERKAKLQASRQRQTKVVRPDGPHRLSANLGTQVGDGLSQLSIGNSRGLRYAIWAEEYYAKSSATVRGMARWQK